MSAAIITSVVTGGSNNHSTVSEEANAYATDFVTAGVLGSITNTNGIAPTTGSFGVNQDASPDMGITIKGSGVTGSGNAVGYVSGVPSGQGTQLLRARMSSDYTGFVINANSSGVTQFDWIYLSLSAANASTPDSAADNVITIVSARGTSNTVAPGGAPTYGVLLAVVTVANGASSIVSANISDRRTLATLTGAPNSTTNGWTALSTGPATVTALGNRSYSLVFNGVDFTSLLSPGMRLQLFRTAPAPTLCTNLNGSTQYYNKTSPASMSFTNFPVVSAWIKLSSYADSDIVSRMNGTQGWEFRADVNGCLALVGYNAALANFSQVKAYQSLPLNKWVHVAAQLDMSTSTLDGTHNYIMIDGVSVPVVKGTGGTNPSALVQAGNLEVGSANGGIRPFPGKIAQVAIYSAAVTQATILASMTQTLVGTETNLVSAYSFNNAITDLAANNNLTAQGSAVATATDSPYAQGGLTSGVTEYGMVTAASFSTNTTLTVQVPEGCALPTSGGVSAVSYSGVKVPYKFPSQRGKWTLEAIYKERPTGAAGTGGTFSNFGHSFNLPIGEWSWAFQMAIAYTHSGVAFLGGVLGLSTANNTLSDSSTGLGTPLSSSTLTEADADIGKTGYFSLAAATTYYLNQSPVNSAQTVFLGSATGNISFIRFENGYL